MGKNYITALDIGTFEIKAAVVSVGSEKGELVRFFKHPSAGLRRGAVLEISDLVQNLSPVIFEIKKFSRQAAKNIFVNFNSSETKEEKSKGIIAVSHPNNEITSEDMERVRRAAEAINLGSNREVLHNIAQQYIVDGVSVADPLGLNGNRLEVESLIINAFSPHIRSLVKAIETAGGEVRNVIFSPLADGTVLSRSQKELGAMVIDIGAGITSLAIYREKKLIKTAIFPLGGNNITNDIAIGFKIPISLAENLKVNYGCAYAKEINQKEMIDLSTISDYKSIISRRFLAEIIESRLEEIIDLIKDELKTIAKDSLPAGVVLVGGTARLPFISELISDKLKVYSQIGSTDSSQWAINAFLNFPGIVEDPMYVNVLGLAQMNSLIKKEIKIDISNIGKFFKMFIP
jgi:cell division protein FtsA